MSELIKERRRRMRLSIIRRRTRRANTRYRDRSPIHQSTTTVVIKSVAETRRSRRQRQRMTLSPYSTSTETAGGRARGPESPSGDRNRLRGESERGIPKREAYVRVLNQPPLVRMPNYKRAPINFIYLQACHSPYIYE